MPAPGKQNPFITYQKSPASFFQDAIQKEEARAGGDQGGLFWCWR
jgi:hypothetical protein